MMITVQNFVEISTSPTNGDLRFVIHYTNLASDYKDAVAIGKKYNGRKFNNKKYGGGVVFCCETKSSLGRLINVLNKDPSIINHRHK